MLEIKIFLLIFLLLCIYFIPDKYTEYLQHIISKIHSKCLIFFTSKSLFNANLLLLACSTSNSFFKMDFNSIEYKFFPDLLNRVKMFNKCYGTPVNKYLVDIRKSLLMDIKFERKINSEQNKTIIQSIFLVLMMIFYILLYRNQMELNISNVFICLTISFQMFGVLTVNWFYKLIKIKFFKEYKILYGVLYTLKIRLEVGGSIQDVLEDTQLNNAYQLKGACFSPILMRLERIVIAWQHSGTSISNEVKELITEVDFILEESLEKFLQAVVFIRFLSLACFFLVPFMAINLYFFAIMFH